MAKMTTILGAVALSVLVAAPLRAETTADTVVATVNGTEITLGHKTISEGKRRRRIVAFSDKAAAAHGTGGMNPSPAGQP